ncbi:MAG: FtsX-like permease family protein [Oscillatoriales cyanobacterium C42_A2020_001]|nr:FtsX-like permease family protein [Leptolyngbyaceae cyanobacterium C42_A2020_001]
MASIARKNLLEDIPRFIVAQAGIMFAVSLVTIQVGILDGFGRSTVRLIEQSDADIWVGAKEMLHLDVTLPIPLERLIQARKVTGVKHAEALMSRQAVWLDSSDRIVPVRVWGFNPSGRLFGNGMVSKGSLETLKEPYSFITDRSNLATLNLKQVGDIGKIVPFRAKLTGLSEDTQSMASSTSLFASLENANAFGGGNNSSLNCTIDGGQVECLNPSQSFNGSKAQTAASSPRRLNLADPISYVLVEVEPGQDLAKLKQQLEAALPGTRAHTKEEIADITRAYWQQRTGVGFILGLGATVGVVVGMVVVSQILYSSVSDHIKEFGTLKAMGASDWVIYGVITEQALWMAILGYIPSMAFCFALGAWTVAAKGIVILITPATAIAVFGVTVVMCVGSALFAIQKVTHVDPAIVFKA